MSAWQNGQFDKILTKWQKSQNLDVLFFCIFLKTKMRKNPVPRPHFYGKEFTCKYSYWRWQNGGSSGPSQFARLSDFPLSYLTLSTRNTHFLFFFSHTNATKASELKRVVPALAHRNKNKNRHKTYTKQKHAKQSLLIEEWITQKWKHTNPHPKIALPVLAYSSSRSAPKSNIFYWAKSCVLGVILRRYLGQCLCPHIYVCTDPTHILLYTIFELGSPLWN